MKFRVVTQVESVKKRSKYLRHVGTHIVESDAPTLPVCLGMRANHDYWECIELTTDVESIDCPRCKATVQKWG